MNKLKFGLVGAGGIAQAYAQAFNESKCCGLIAVADVREESAAALAESVGGTPYNDYKLLADVELDAVIVATPPATHPEIACFFMERGTPVLCEKPLTTNVADAEKMIAAAEKAGVQFTMASKFRYCEDVIAATGEQVSRALAGGGHYPSELGPVEASLEDAFFALTTDVTR